jgi:hypothetical protein
MSEKHLYEKHLAEKLQQISPPPDMDGNWQKMKLLLDDDQPRGGGYGKRWWQIGVIAGILLIGAWIAGTQLSESGKKDLVGKPNSANVEDKKLPDATAKATTGNQKAANGNGTTPADSDNNSLPVSAKNESSGTAGKANDPGSGLVDNKPSIKTRADENNRSLKTEPDGNKKNNKVINDADIGADKNVTRNNPGRKNNNKYTDKNSTKDDLTLHSTKEGNRDNENKTNTATNSPVRKPVDYSPVDDNTTFTSASPNPADNLKTDFSLLSLHAKSVLKSKSARAAKSRQGRSFSFGFSLPLAFPLGDQKALSYNFNAGANTVSDYIPSPHVQYRLNDKTYLQTELQFIAPQYIRPILLYENRYSQAGQYMIYNSIYARKLYYFNLPVGIHHSPFKDFYLGTGLQFSTLLSGVGLYEQTKRSMSGQPMSLISESYGRLSGDSLSNRMNTAEVRLMLEMNYYFNKFTFGLRYNQAFNNYVNFRLDNMSPYTFDKNKALQFYLRYNLWEDVRRRPNGKGSLSSK